jgi:hypothetical protein
LLAGKLEILRQILKVCPVSRTQAPGCPQDPLRTGSQPQTVIRDNVSRSPIPGSPDLYKMEDRKCLRLINGALAGVLKIDTEIASEFYIRVHSSRDRHCRIYRYKYVSGRVQVEVSKARSKSTTANNRCFRYSGGRSSSNASPEKQYKTRVGEPKALRPADLEVARTPAHHD